jgi:hypothetical protein
MLQLLVIATGIAYIIITTMNFDYKHAWTTKIQKKNSKSRAGPSFFFFFCRRADLAREIRTGLVSGLTVVVDERFYEKLKVAISA